MAARPIDWPGLERVVEGFLASRFGGTPGNLFIKPWGWTRQVQRLTKRGYGVRFSTELRVPLHLEFAAAFCSGSYSTAALGLKNGSIEWLNATRHFSDDLQTPLRQEIARWWGLKTDLNSIQLVFQTRALGDTCNVIFYSPYSRARKLPSVQTLQNDFRLSRRDALATRVMIEQADTDAGHPPTMNHAFRQIARLWNTRAVFAIQGVTPRFPARDPSRDIENIPQRFSGTVAWWVEAPPDGPSLIYDVDTDAWSVTSIGSWETSATRRRIQLGDDWLRRLPA